MNHDAPEVVNNIELPVHVRGETSDETDSGKKGDMEDEETLKTLGKGVK